MFNYNYGFLFSLSYILHCSTIPSLWYPLALHVVTAAINSFLCRACLNVLSHLWGERIPAEVSLMPDKDMWFGTCIICSSLCHGLDKVLTNTSGFAMANTSFDRLNLTCIQQCANIIIDWQRVPSKPATAYWERLLYIHTFTHQQTGVEFVAKRHLLSAFQPQSRVQWRLCKSNNGA